MAALSWPFNLVGGGSRRTGPTFRAAGRQQGDSGRTRSSTANGRPRAARPAADFHVDPLRRDLSTCSEARCASSTWRTRPAGTEQVNPRGRECCLLPALVPHSPHRPPDTWGPGGRDQAAGPRQTESLLWYCDRCDRLLHQVTMHVADIERELKDGHRAPSTPTSRLAPRAAGLLGTWQPEPGRRSSIRSRKGERRSASSRAPDREA